MVLLSFEAGAPIQEHRVPGATAIFDSGRAARHYSLPGATKEQRETTKISVICASAQTAHNGETEKQHIPQKAAQVVSSLGPASSAGNPYARPPVDHKKYRALCRLAHSALWRGGGESFQLMECPRKDRDATGIAFQF
jgi:hypothetical protein